MSTEENDVHLAAPLNLSWSFGINKHVPVLNLSTDNTKELFYVTGHTGVLYNFETNTQTLYQGHCNNITATCVSEDKKWLATADIGKDNMIIVWDVSLNIPIKTLFDVDFVGIRKISFSKDAKFLASLGAGHTQVVSIWNWTTGDEIPLVTISIEPTLHSQDYIAFNPSDSQDVVSNSSDQVIFHRWNLDGDISSFAPKLDDKDFNKTVGAYSQTIYQPNSLVALTGTDCGNIVVWTRSVDSTSEMKPLKIVHVQERAITTLSTISNYLVATDVNGYVKFFDFELKLVHWYKQMGCQGAINGISFTYHEPDLTRPTSAPIQQQQQQQVQEEDDEKDEMKENVGIYPSKSTLEGEEFVVNDFSVSTNRAQYLYFKTNGSQATFIRKEHEEDIKAMACHPTGSFLAIGSYSGLLQVMDYETKKLLQCVQYKGNHVRITCLQYSCHGDYLAIGFDTGHVKILDAVTLNVEGSMSDDEENEARFDYSNDSIKRMAFSYDNAYLACTDEDNCLVVYILDEKDKIAPWKYLGKHRAHYKPISDVIFLRSLDEGNVRLLSLGEDRMLVEYDLPNSGLDDLRILSSDRIEQDGVPITLSVYPPVVKESFFLISNDQHKLKLFNTTTKMCRHTFLGPTYGSYIKRIVVLPEQDESLNRYMAYCTVNKIGLSIFPLDGNPYKSMALIAHPNGVHNLVCSFDGKYVFTSGGDDTTVFMWKIDANALEASAKLGGEGLTPFYTLIEGGREGELFSELEEFFYYAQMKNQGVDTMEERKVSGTIPLSEMPFVMRGLGFYPSEQQIEEMTNEVKFSNYVDTGNYVEDINLETLIKLYINHRPVFGLHPEQLVEAFGKIGIADEEGNVEISRSHLLSILQDKGEHLTEAELADYLTHLFGTGNEGGGSKDISLEEQLPEKISVSMFAKQLLGLDLSLGQEV